MRILAIDGALNHSGWVILDEDGGEGWDAAKLIQHGIILAKPTMSLAQKLLHTRQEIFKIAQKYKPDEIVFEDTYAGQNPLTTARLNNAKGVILVTIFEILKRDPVCVTAGVARACLGFKNGKDPKVEPWEFFSKKYRLKKLNFKSGNDITDACVLGWWRIVSLKGECAEKKKKAKKIREKIAKSVKEKKK
jgi:Holliday junction resolvasome RuvABC endonuclease subunit